MKKSHAYAWIQIGAIMAACDNLYGNRKEWNELHDFLVNTRPEWVDKYMYRQPEDDVEVRICYVASIQEYLIQNCPLTWVHDRLNDNCDIQRMINGKAHHE